MGSFSRIDVKSLDFHDNDAVAHDGMKRLGPVTQTSATSSSPPPSPLLTRKAVLDRSAPPTARTHFNEGKIDNNNNTDIIPGDHQRFDKSNLLNLIQSIERDHESSNNNRKTNERNIHQQGKTAKTKTTKNNKTRQKPININKMLTKSHTQKAEIAPEVTTSTTMPRKVQQKKSQRPSQRRHTTSKDFLV